jgi:hypothetical protein
MNLGYKNLEKLLNEKEIQKISYFRHVGPFLEFISSNSVWPNGCYFFQNEFKVNTIVSENINLKSEILFIIKSDLDKLNLRELGFRPIDFWYSMYFICSTFEYKSGVSLKFLNSKDSYLKNWKLNTELVFFKGGVLSDDLLNVFLNSDKFKLVYFYKDQNIVGQALLYFNNNEVGLYFFTIYELFRKNGYGYEALASICNFSFANGYHKLLLQSTRQGKNMYCRFGFVPEDLIYIFKKKLT